MKKLLMGITILALLSGCGTTRTETYQADFEKKQSITAVSDYDGKPIPVQVLSIGISENVLNSYPILKEKNVGLGVTNIALDYLEGTSRFEFTEDKEEIKLKMVKQFQASAKGFTENILYILKFMISLLTNKKHMLRAKNNLK